MTRFSETFSNRHVVLPVIHLKNFAQALRNAKLALDAGADGVFLINHRIGKRKSGHRYLYEVYERLKQQLPEFWMGVNCLDLYPEEVFNTAPDAVQGVWADNAGIDENAEEQLIPQDVDHFRQKRDMLYFGGVAFKYQNPVFDLAHVAQIAIKHMDVVTTSGRGTGWAAEIAKIKKMKQAVGDFPLAIASGITPQNVGNYMPIADCFLVATGISKTFYEFDADKTQQLIKKVRKGC